MEDVSSIMEYLENSIQQNPDFNFSSIANDLSSQSSIKHVHFGGKTFMYEEKPGKNVGSVIWSSATSLADFLCTQNLTDQIVVDLGAGIGLLSLVAAGQGANVISTELLESLPDLQKTIQLNNSTEKIITRSFNLAQDQVQTSFPENINLVIGSELIYDMDMTNDLIKICSSFLQEKMCRIVLSFQNRWPQPQNLFLEKLGHYITQRKEENNVVLIMLEPLHN